MKPDLSVEIAGIQLKNPVMTASGTFGCGREYADLVDLKKLGAIVAKTVTLEPRKGNPPPRICETPSGMLNAIGLQNEGIDRFIEKEMPFLKKVGVPVIVNIAGDAVSDYVELCRRLSSVGDVAAIELNVSCPNVKAGGIAFGMHPGLVSEVVGACRRATGLPLIVKLTPNVGSVVGIARAAVGAGADAVSLINTVIGMSIDHNTFQPRLASGFGGLSGPAIRPIAVRMVWEVARELDVPIIGMGGVGDALDAVEFILAGATAVAVGTANFINPRATIDLIDGLEEFLIARGMDSVRDLVGKVKMDGSSPTC
ncbi:MAG: dihydroorotate dehydrogenase [Actinobacteria bacterium]|nr:dihydroorotate dehydrogenase [Actinomycetota bacterium]